MTVGNSFPGPSGVTDTTEGRKAFAGLVETDASGNVRTGLFPSNATAVVAARADMNLDVAAFTAVASQFPAGATAIFFANDGSAQLGAALVSPGAGTTNYYIVYAKQNESTAPGTDANTNAVLSAALSTVSLATARAALPQGAVELAEVTMPTGKTATNNAGVVITQTFKYTASEGGVVWLRNSAEATAWSPADGALAYQMDTAAFLLRSGGAWGPAVGLVPACRVTVTTAGLSTSGTPNTFTAIPWNVETFDTTGTMHDNVTNNSRLVAPAAGYYRAHGKLSYSSGATGAIQIAKNGSAIAESQTYVQFASGAFADVHTDTIVLLAAGDYIEVQMGSTSAGAAVAQARCFAEIVFLRGA